MIIVPGGDMEGIIIFLITFFLIGIFHPLVIIGEYYFGKKSINISHFLVLFFVIISIYIKSLIPSILQGS